MNPFHSFSTLPYHSSFIGAQPTDPHNPHPDPGGVPGAPKPEIPSPQPDVVIQPEPQREVQAPKPEVVFPPTQNPEVLPPGTVARHRFN